MKNLKRVVCMLGVLMCVWMFGAVVVMAAEPPVEVEEITDEDLDASMLYGARVVVTEGTKYYASADEFGSGPYGTIGNQYTPLDVDSSATDIYLPMNSLADIASYDRIIIVTDTEHNVDYSSLNKRFGFGGKIVVVCTYELRYIRQSTIREIEDAFNTKLYLCRLDNELDRIRAIEKLDK